jgi:phenylalanyl-tRNA synthetase beta chain
MFEAAKFARDNIRKSSRALGQNSDASQRYSKGVDEYATEMAMKRVLHLIEELGCGKVSKTHQNANTGNSLEPVEYKTSIKKVNGVLGITVPNEDILRILTGLNFQPVINGDELTIQIPAYREDMESYPDIAEEVIRMYGYDHIVSTFLPTAKVTIGGNNVRQKTVLKVKKALCSVGAFEGMHYSFFSPADLDEMGYSEDAPERHAIRLMNPINEDLSLMRTTLAPQMIHAMGRNQKRGIYEGRIFEVGNIFIADELPLTTYPEERETLCIGVFGKNESFFTLKGMAETVADVLHVQFTYAPAQKTFLHPYQTASISCEGEEIGYLGKVRYEIVKEEAMREDAYVLEINMKALEKWYGKAPVFEPLPKFAEDKRDLALVMDKHITCAEVEKCIKEACSFVKDVTLFDVYEGKQIADDKKSMAFSILFSPKDEEFGTDTVDGYVKKVLKQLGKKMGIELRS